MADLGYQSNLGLLRRFFDEFRGVSRQETPGLIPRLALNYVRAALSLLCSYPNKKLASLPLYRWINLFILCNIMNILWTMIFALPETKNAIDMGDDLVWISGMALVFTKIFYVHLRCDKIDELIYDFDYYNRELRPHNNDEEVLGWQRLSYLVESGLYMNCFCLVNFFSAAIFLQPLISEGKLPFHSVWPFQWHRMDLHPNKFWALYIWMSVTSQHNLMSILMIDMVGISTFLQTALNLKLLCIEMRKLGEMRVSDARFHEEFCKVVRYHQHIIKLLEKANNAYNGAFNAQMISSFSLISISAFETMATAAVDPKMAAKFVLLMVVAFTQLSLWCISGTLVYTQSLEVAQAAFDINDWHTKAPEIQRDISFVIMRAQKPLMYVAEPFLPFTLGTYMLVLKNCYRLLALMQESM
ncbi:LOW QUALITY PROTEIN: odorant receptor 47b [Drosophila ficusphila]|uniref:LOW QUALITY PROTEIN: odorant receptor 47b n=1 Tax=Drosophila ficusphila TaxID=30025 RepID=UPI0007E6B894|nr:LOW QUALITY PROTEIN: odorant receptor 47b [Drosophila ficusphila]